MKCTEFPVRRGNFPDARAPVEEIRRIRAGENCVGGKVWIIEGDQQRRNDVARALNIDVARIGMMDAKDTRGIVEGVASGGRFLEFVAAKLASARRNAFRDER